MIEVVKMQKSRKLEMGMGRSRILQMILRGELYVRSRILQRKWVSDSENSFIYEMVSGAVNWTELRGGVGLEYCKELEGDSERWFTGATYSGQVTSSERNYGVVQVTDPEQVCNQVVFSSWSTPTSTYLYTHYTRPVIDDHIVGHASGGCWDDLR